MVSFLIEATRLPMAQEGEFGGEAYGGFHAVGAGYAATGDLEGGAVVRAGAYEREAERDIHPFVERMKFERDQPLVVIHAKHSVKFPLDRAVENRVWSERPLKDTTRGQLLNSGCNHLDLLATEVSIFTSVGIQTSHGDTGTGNAPRTKKIGEEFSHAKDFLGADQVGNARERHMGGDQCHRERATCQAHREIFHPGSTGEEFGLAGKFETNLVHGTLADGTGDDRLPFARCKLLGGGFQGGEGFSGRGGGRLSKRVGLSARKHFNFTTGGQHQILQRRRDDLGAYPCGIAGRDANANWRANFHGVTFQKSRRAAKQKPSG